MYNTIQQTTLSSSYVDKFLHDMRAEKHSKPSKKSSPVILPTPQNNPPVLVSNIENDEDLKESSPTERIIHELAQSMSSSPLSSITQTQQENDVFTTSELISAEFETCTCSKKLLIKKIATTTTFEQQSIAHDKKDILILFLLQHVCKQMNPDPTFFGTVSKRLLETQILTDPRFANVQYMKQVCKMYIPEAAKTVYNQIYTYICVVELFTWWHRYWQSCKKQQQQ